MSPSKKILAVILGGGRGSRLFPLTKLRSKPAVPIAGKYRLIDIPISNCINSNIYHIAVLTQFNSVSLHRHIVRTFYFDAFHTGWVQIWAAEQTMQFTDWYQGTADAVRKQLLEIKSTRASHVLILAGDHLYHMDYSKMVDFHIENDADITVAVQPIKKDEAGRFGILKREGLKISDFAEKPKDPTILKNMVSRNDAECPFLGSMGIYLFKTDVLIALLENTNFEDFGNEVIPHAISTNTVYGYDFEGFWVDIGTIRSFYETNLALTTPDPPFDFFIPSRPIYTHTRQLPGSVVENSHLKNVLLCEGCFIENAEIRHSVIGLRSQVRNGVYLADSILMGADFYEEDQMEEYQTDSNKIPLGIGENCQIEGAIIDKNARVGDNVVIKPFPLGTDDEQENWVIIDGIVVIPKNTTIPPGTTIGP